MTSKHASPVDWMWSEKLKVASSLDWNNATQLAGWCSIWCLDVSTLAYPSKQHTKWSIGNGSQTDHSKQGWTAVQSDLVLCMCSIMFHIAQNTIFFWHWCRIVELQVVGQTDLRTVFLSQNKRCSSNYIQPFNPLHSPVEICPRFRYPD